MTRVYGPPGRLAMPRRRGRLRGLPLLAVALLAACAPAAVTPAITEAGPAGAPGAPAVASGQDELLERLFADRWESALRESPLFATSIGDRRYNDRLGGVSAADEERRVQVEREFLRRLEAIDRSALDREQQISYDIFGRQVRNAIQGYAYRGWLIPITNRTGFHTSFPQLHERVPLATTADYENYIARLLDFRRYVDEHIDLMRTGIREGMTLPRVVLTGVEQTLTPHIVDDPEASMLWAPFSAFSAGVPEAERARLAEAGRDAIRTAVVPGYRRFLAFITDEYVPAARQTLGASELPNGAEYYAHLARTYTTLELTPAEIHELGLAEVSRIRSEMDEVIRGTGFTGSFDEFLAFLRTDPRFYVDSPEELLRETAWVLKRIDGELPRLFGRLPRMPYGLRPIPDFIAPRTTTAYYSRPSGDGERAGFYWLNTYDLGSRPLYEIEALSLHEAVPGHHLQLALQQELEDLPPFRRFAGFTVFVEGWALYAERLGLEVGFYTDPYSDFGRLTYEMWRACRLVVDTGLHAFGWERQRAIDFMAANTALTLLNITNEVDRYIAWPGQALAYKIGELKIRELRAEAERRLGDRFDVRAFHDVVLGSGSVPLDVLEENVRRWVAERAAEVS